VTGQLLTTRQVAEFVGCSLDTILRRWRAGELPGYRLSSNALRFDVRDVDEWLERLKAGDATRGVSATQGATRREEAILPRSATPLRHVAARTEEDEDAR
jgi:excisionase family DNA binding protein